MLAVPCSGTHRAEDGAQLSWGSWSPVGALGWAHCSLTPGCRKNPRSQQCIASITWKINDTLHGVTALGLLYDGHVTASWPPGGGNKGGREHSSQCTRLSAACHTAT